MVGRILKKVIVKIVHYKGVHVTTKKIKTLPYGEYFMISTYSLHSYSNNNDDDNSLLKHEKNICLLVDVQTFENVIVKYRDIKVKTHISRLKK